ncbi:MAG: sialidase family protein [Candidatus Latescibacteria bacterium]|jgi:hypothetical protein|nr:sialidase family protein [Candidatus Latescibacterota bacterium]MDP7449953.1 sialidase family protein [Candidatus Latescibacterota bacterium]HJP32028.1 sialidase family protein [Candidatus Latescibacterota bacterium]
MIDPDPIDEAALRDMQSGDYILHSRDGRLQQLPVEKTRLPRDPSGHVQRLNFVSSPDGTLYAAQHSLWHRSTDAGISWIHMERNPPEGGWRVEFAPDGAMVNVTQQDGGVPTVWSSSDEGGSWEQIGQIDTDVPGARIDLGFSITRLPGGSLLVPVLVVADEVIEGNRYVSGSRVCRLYRSDDGGRSWSLTGTIGQWCHEVNVAVLPDGRLLAVIRLQRPRLSGDPDDLGERTGAGDSGWPYKHVFISHSTDEGRTWESPRQLCEEYGQCYGAAGVLADNTVAVVHDHRYPRALGSGRARVSHDGGDYWQDETYYLVHGHAAGYAATLSPDGERFLTLAGSCYGDVDAGWDVATGHTDFVIIDWRPR